MRYGLPTILLLFPALSAGGAELSPTPRQLLDPTPARVIRLEKKGRMPASVEKIHARKAAELDSLNQKLTLGSYAIIQNSVEEWNNQVVQVTALYDDRSRQIRLDSGKFARVKFPNLATLSPEKKTCCKSAGTDICPGDSVYHPLPTTSLGVPEGKVRRLFENCTAMVRDGIDYLYEAKQLGKPVNCSPQKESVCVGKTVYVEGFREGKRYEFEGPVVQPYSQGLVLVRTGLWLLPVDISSVRVQTESIYPASPLDASIITARDGQAKIPVPTYPELEPANPDDAQQLHEKRGITEPAR